MKRNTKLIQNKEHLVIFFTRSLILLHFLTIPFHVFTYRGSCSWALPEPASEILFLLSLPEYSGTSEVRYPQVHIMVHCCFWCPVLLHFFWVLRVFIFLTIAAMQPLVCSGNWGRLDTPLSISGTHSATFKWWEPITIVWSDHALARPVCTPQRQTGTYCPQ